MLSQGGETASRSPKHSDRRGNGARSQSPMRDTTADVAADEGGPDTTDHATGNETGDCDLFSDGDSDDECFFEEEMADEDDDPTPFIASGSYDLRDFFPQTDPAPETKPQVDLKNTTATEDIVRFELNILNLFKFMKDWVGRFDSVSELREAGYALPMTHGWFNAFKDDAVTGPQLLSLFPARVKATLGRKNLTITDLMELPGLAVGCTD